MQILIAEDDLIFRKLLSRLLTNLGHEVIQADDGLKAWNLWLIHRSPLVISDWLMPKMSGLDLSHKIRSYDQAKYTYIIMLTSQSGKQNYMQAMDSGVDDFMTKPFDRDTVCTRINVAERIINLQAENIILSGLLPICSYCKNIRDDKNYWQKVESYLENKSSVRFSHGICPDCYEKHLKPQIADLKRKKIP